LFENREEGAPLKLIDFGFSKSFSKSMSDIEKPTGDVVQYMKTFAGTCFYMAPEVIKGSYNHLCDLWSVGIMIHVLLSGFPPFFSDDKDEIMKLIQEGILKFDGISTFKLKMIYGKMFLKMQKT
jgi:calcium-dependent protein kinase